MRVCSLLLSSALLVSTTQGKSSGKLPHMDDFLVEGLEEVEPEYAKFEGSMYAGRLPMDNGDRHGELMFWFFAPENPTNKDSVTVWLNGGPGCSSFNCGVMFENSPVTVPLRPAGYPHTTKDEPFVYNKYSWTNATSMLYVEQPVGVGYSTGGPDPEVEADLAGDFYIFIQNFFKVFRPYQSSDLFIVGESYAGYYAPSIAYEIFKEQQKLDENEDDVVINLAGVALGNGWANALVQGPATIDYAYWHGMFDEHTRQALHAEWDHCVNSGKDEPEPEGFHKVNAPDDCAMMVANLMAGGKGVWSDNVHGPNTYDVTTWDSYPVILAANSSIENFFNDPMVKEKLHAPKDVFWTGCIPGAGRRLKEGRRVLAATLLQNDQPMSTVPYLAEMLDGGIRVLIYNGDRDLSTNAQGSEMLLNDMEWSGAKDWFTKDRGLWVNPDNVDMPAGFAKSHKGLDFVVVYNSGHLVPYNQPSNALDLITRFLLNESYYDYPLPDFDFFHKTSNPGISLANGMYPTLSSLKVEPSSETAHHGLWVALTVIASFAAGFLVSSLINRQRMGYEKV